VEDVEQGHQEPYDDFSNQSSESEIARLLKTVDLGRLKQIFESSDPKAKEAMPGQPSIATNLFQTPYQASSSRAREIPPPF